MTQLADVYLRTPSPPLQEALAAEGRPVAVGVEDGSGGVQLAVMSQHFGIHRCCCRGPALR